MSFLVRRLEANEGLRVTTPAGEIEVIVVTSRARDAQIGIRAPDDWIIDRIKAPRPGVSS